MFYYGSKMLDIKLSINLHFLLALEQCCYIQIYRLADVELGEAQ